MTEHLLWKDLSAAEQEYFVRTAEKGSVAFNDLTKGCMPSCLTLYNRWTVQCYYTYAFSDQLQIFVDPDAPILPEQPDHRKDDPTAIKEA